MELSPPSLARSRRILQDRREQLANRDIDPQMVIQKHQIEAALYAEKQDVQAGRIKEDNPLDLSDEFRVFCEACRRGDLKICQEQITAGANINARDRFDYTPLILVSDFHTQPQHLL